MTLGNDVFPIKFEEQRAIGREAISDELMPIIDRMTWFENYGKHGFLNKDFLQINPTNNEYEKLISERHILSNTVRFSVVQFVGLSKSADGKKLMNLMSDITETWGQFPGAEVLKKRLFTIWATRLEAIGIFDRQMLPCLFDEFIGFFSYYYFKNLPGLPLDAKKALCVYKKGHFIWSSKDGQHSNERKLNLGIILYR